MTPLILASASPRRRILLRQAGYRFRVRPSSIHEVHDDAHVPARMVSRLAREKAMDVSSRTRDGIVIGADTIVVLDGHVLGKPRDARQARSMLRSLSGRTHTVYTGVALVDARSRLYTSFYERTRVTFRNISASEIAEYVRSGSPLDKAGAYGIQDDFGAVFVEKVAGCFYNVVGFPLSRFYVELPRFERTVVSSTKKVSR